MPKKPVDIDLVKRFTTVFSQSGLSQEAFGEKIGQKQHAISPVLKGIREPSKSMLREIISKFDVSANWLYTGDDEASPNLYSQGLPREARDAIQKAVQMVEDFISVIPTDIRLEDKVKKGLYVMLVADLLVAGRQEEIPDTMSQVIQSFSRRPEKP